jgi:hypothetical protein
MLEARSLPSRPAQALVQRPGRIRGSSPNPARVRGEGRVKPALAILFPVLSVLLVLSALG